MSRYKTTHNDIKPANFVVKRNVSRNSFPHQIYLTDFGLSEKKGGTPIFASPECFDDDKPNGDTFSLGRVFLYIILSKSSFLLWLYLPIEKNLKSTIDDIIHKDPFFKLIANMTRMKNRSNIKTVRKNFDILRAQLLLNLDKSLEITVNNTLAKMVNSELIKKFKVDYIDGLYNLS